MKTKLIIWDKEGYEELPKKMKGHITTLCRVIPQLYPDIEVAVLREASGVRTIWGRFKLFFASEKHFIRLRLTMTKPFSSPHPRYRIIASELQKEFQFFGDPALPTPYVMERYWEWEGMTTFTNLVGKLREELKAREKKLWGIEWYLGITLPWAFLVPSLFYDEDMVKAILIQMIIHPY